MAAHDRPSEGSNWGAPSLMGLVADALAAEATVIHLAAYKDGRVHLRWRQYGMMVEAPSLDLPDALRIVGELHGDADWRPDWSAPAESLFESLEVGHAAAVFPDLVDLLDVQISPVMRDRAPGILCVIKPRGGAAF